MYLVLSLVHKMAHILDRLLTPFFLGVLLRFRAVGATELLMLLNL